MVHKGSEHWEYKHAGAYVHETTITTGLSWSGRAVHIGNVDGRWGLCACYPRILRGGITTRAGSTWGTGYILPPVLKIGNCTRKRVWLMHETYSPHKPTHKYSKCVHSTDVLTYPPRHNWSLGHRSSRTGTGKTTAATYYPHLWQFQCQNRYARTTVK